MSNVSVPKIPLSNFECVHCGRIYHDADLCSSDDCPGNDIAMPELLNHWTVDEVAECLDGWGKNFTENYGHILKQQLMAKRHWLKLHGVI